MSGSESSKVKKENCRLACAYCKKDFLIKSFSNHLIKEHIETIFGDKKNASQLELRVSKAKIGGWFDPVEITIRGKEMWFCCCCDTFYSKKVTADAHRKKPECKQSFKPKGEELIKSLKETGNIHITTGDNTIINLSVTDNSGALIECVKRLASLNDVSKSIRADYFKKLQKVKKAVATFKERHPELEDEIDELCCSDISSVKSAYDSDDSLFDDPHVQDGVLDRTDPADYMNCKFYKGCKVDISREALGLRTKAQHDKDKAEREELKREEEEYERDQERMRREEAEDERKRTEAKEKRERNIKIFEIRMNKIRGDLDTYIATYGKDDVYYSCMRD